MDKLFVYGTLKLDFSHNYRLEKIGEEFKKATFIRYQFDKES